MSDTRDLHFRALVPPVPMISKSLGGQVVLVVGHWVDAKGREVKAHAFTMGASRALTDLRPIPPAPDFTPYGDDGR